MMWKRFSALILFIILALSLVIVGAIEGSDILYAFALAVLSVGLGANSFIISLKIEEKMNEKMKNIDSAIAQIAAAREEIKIALREQPGASKSIAEAIQAFYQMYIGRLAKQQPEEEQSKK